MGNLFSGILSGFTLVGDVSLGRALVTIILAFIMGLFILFIYKRTFTGVVYTKSIFKCRSFLRIQCACAFGALFDLFLFSDSAA